MNHPANMTYPSIPKDVREACDVDDGLIRLRVGIEGLVDMHAVLQTAMG